jgi:hypothetical protein
MSPFSCEHEREVADLLHHGFWPDACPPELRAHVETCKICSDLLLVTQTFQRDRKLAAEIPVLESAGALWWRAQLRRRSAAIETMTRPILGAQMFAFVIAFVVTAAILVGEAGNWRTWIADLPRALHLGALLPSAFTGTTGTLWIIVPVLATVAVLSGVVVYLAAEKQ